MARTKLDVFMENAHPAHQPRPDVVKGTRGKSFPKRSGSLISSGSCAPLNGKPRIFQQGGDRRARIVRVALPAFLFCSVPDVT